MNRPVLLRGLNGEWPAWEKYTRENLMTSHGGLDVHVSGPRRGERSKDIRKRCRSHLAHPHLHTHLHPHPNFYPQVSDIPYNNKFGSPNGEDRKLGQYIDAMAGHSLSGGDHPWYLRAGGCGLGAVSWGPWAVGGWVNS